MLPLTFPNVRNYSTTVLHYFTTNIVMEKYCKLLSSAHNMRVRTSLSCFKWDSARVSAVWIGAFEWANNALDCLFMSLSTNLWWLSLKSLPWLQKQLMCLICLCDYDTLLIWLQCTINRRQRDSQCSVCIYWWTIFRVGKAVLGTRVLK